MAEIIFILTTVFVAYVVYHVLECEKEAKAKKASPVKPAPKSAAAKPASKPKPAPVAKKPTPAKKVTASAPASSAELPETLRNPATGEESKVASNYRFTKRWIKDALVEEGLLDKVYKNNELDDAATAKIEAALLQLRGMQKYQ